MGRIRDAVKAYEVVCGGRRKKGWWEIVYAIADALEPEEKAAPAKMDPVEALLKHLDIHRDNDWIGSEDEALCKCAEMAAAIRDLKAKAARAVEVTDDEKATIRTLLTHSTAMGHLRHTAELSNAIMCFNTLVDVARRAAGLENGNG